MIANRPFRFSALPIAGVLACCGLPRVLAAPAETPAATVVSNLDINNMGAYFSVLAVSPDGKRGYAGYQHPLTPRSMNLATFTLNGGKVVGETRRYASSPEVLKVPSDNIATILAPARYKKLYLTHVASESKLLAVYDVDKDGEPVGAPRAYAPGATHAQLWSAALHPRLNLLYLGGWAEDGIFVYQLDDKGEPRGAAKWFPLGPYGKSQLSVSPDGKRLYMGAYPDQLQVAQLDDAGMPVGPPKEFPAGKQAAYFKFEYTTRALYLRRETPAGPRLAVWKLDGDGCPVGEPQIQEGKTVTAIAADDHRNRLWAATEATFVDAMTDVTKAMGTEAVPYTIEADGSLTPPAQPAEPRFRQTPTLMAVADGGNAVAMTVGMPAGVLGNFVTKQRMRVTIVDAQTMVQPAPASFLITFGKAGQTLTLGPLTVGAPSEWVDLDPFLKDIAGAPHYYIHAGGGEFRNLKFKVELAQLEGSDETATYKPLKTLTEEVSGSLMLLFLPGYGYEPPKERLAAAETFSDHADKYVAAAKEGQVAPKDRPKKFVISAFHLMGGQGSRAQLRKTAEALSLLGINTAVPYEWGAIPPKEIDAIVDSYGLKQRSVGVYQPPSLFAYAKDVMNPDSLAKAAADVLDRVKWGGGTYADIADVKIADEPGWYYPQRYKEVKDNPVYLKEFRSYLQGKGLMPADLGADNWESIFPIGAGSATTLPARRLFYWTARFFPDSSAQSMKLFRLALEKATGRPMETPVNWYNWEGNWYVAAPNVQINRNPEVSPDSAQGAMDWFTSGRTNAHMLWSEDWVGDNLAMNWSRHGDFMRSAAMLGDRTFGGYVVGQMLGRLPEGASYKTLSLVGHGAKAVDFYTWGPFMLFSDGWSESFNAYKPIGQAVGRVGRMERVLFPGKPARGKVALLHPGSSYLWDPVSVTSHYSQEPEYLHQALILAGYTVDFVDDTDVEDGALASRGYSAVYIVGPNISAKAQLKLKEWVAAGGTLAAMPGAGVADQYNTPSTTLDAVLGLKQRSAERDGRINTAEGRAAKDKLTPMDERFADGELSISGPIVKLVVDKAQPVAKLTSGTPAVVASNYGRGRAISYAFYPGWQNYISANMDDYNQLPQGWSPAQRKLTVAPVVIAKTPKAVTLSQEGVEACRLESDKGIAIVLLNWTGKQIPSLTVTVPKAGKFRKTSSGEKGALKGVFIGDSIKLTLPLNTVDVLAIE